MNQQMRSRFLFALAILAVTACSDAVVVCPLDLRVSVSPQDTTIAPGEQFTAVLALYGCHGQTRLSDTITYVSADVSVAVVGTTTGTVIGVRSGMTTISASAKYYGVTMPITVRVR